MPVERPCLRPKHEVNNSRINTIQDRVLRAVTVQHEGPPDLHAVGMTPLTNRCVRVETTRMGMMDRLFVNKEVDSGVVSKKERR
jgi:hypothetical protein